MPVPATQPIAPISAFDLDDDDEGWEDMPVVREDTFASGLDEEDQKKYKYVPSAKGASAVNATGNLIDFDDGGYEWRAKLEQNESEYTRLRGNEEDESDEVHLRTKYLFDEDKAMTPLSQMQATKNLLTEAQRIAYVGLCALITQEMVQILKRPNRKEFKAAIQNMDLWAMKIMARLYYHMELETQEQKMIESLAQHGVQAADLVPALMTTHTVANPEYDPAEARRQSEVIFDAPAAEFPVTPTTATQGNFQTTAKVLADTATTVIPGVSTTLSAADENVTLDIRWTVLCDLFLILIADSVYDARSRVLLEQAAHKLGLGWLDVVRFESRVTEALEIQEDVEKMEQQEVIDGRQKAARKKRYMMLGLATLGGGLVIGLSAGLLAPVIGVGLGAALSTVGITGTTGFLAGAGGAAVITTGGVLTGSSIAVRGMINRTQQVRTFEVLPLHNNKRVNCILTIPGSTTSDYPFSVLDPVVGDVFSVLWEPEMIQETGSALKILTGEVLTQVAQAALQATVMTAPHERPSMAHQYLGYLIDNPWNNALDRAKAAGSVLADVLMQRHLGVRPITLIGFSLGARVIFYALIELAKHKAYGIVQDVFILGTTVSVPTRMWCETRSVVSGRYVNAFARNDWVLNYLFRATSGGVGTVAGLRPVENVPGLENVDVTDKIAGHMSYRTFMPLILDQLGFPVFADYFDDPVEPDFEGDRIVEREEDKNKKKGWFSRKTQEPTRPESISRPPSTTWRHSQASSVTLDDDLPPRVASPGSSKPSPTKDAAADVDSKIPIHAGFDFNAIKDVMGKAELNPDELKIPEPSQFEAPPIPPPSMRSESAPPQTQTPPANADRPAPFSPPSPTRTDLSGAFSRSLSVNDVRDNSDSDDTETDESTPPPPPEKPPAFVPPSALSFGDASGSLWSPAEQDPPRSTSIPAFGYSAAAQNPFSSLSSSSFGPPDTGLSFGGADGSITSGFSSSLSPAADPWAIPSDLGKKKSPAFNSNPWG
ncbi:DUF726-domain-containing protein [Mycena venus]|uniref:DUF726-domain-containing protein n=1 Tax=Mycena venus TaxID=2733690 RepID=A0A8H6XVN7_9AGAR|nr:DUF726-domain-containing protein [Mycena venus]